MPESTPYEPLIDSLARELRPVRRLRPPVLPAALWLLVVGALAFVLASIYGTSAVRDRLAATPDMWLAVTGSAATAILAAFAVFRMAQPDRSPNWAWLPVPGLLLWIGASGLGCLRSWAVPETHVALLSETRSCLTFIVGFSVPLSLLLAWMLRRSYPFRPGLMAAMAGLASAAAAATLLNFCHPFDASATDLTVHAAAVALVVLISRFWGGRALRAVRA